LHILLINTNPVISRLISFNTRNDATVLVDEVKGAGAVPEVQYDLLFVDDNCCGKDEIKKYIRDVRARKKILFGSGGENSIEDIDSVIVKPFLPSDIATVIQSMLQDGNDIEDIGTEDEGGLPVPDDSEDTDILNQSDESLILDSGEIEKIKQLLLDEEEDSTGDKKYTEDADIEAKREKKSPKIKKKSKKQKKSKEKKVSREERILEALTEMKPKKIRKLLDGAEVSITISFPKEV